MSEVLILFAHPALQKSRVHRELMKHALGLPGITFHDLYEEYPEFDVDAGREQELLKSHDVIVMQFPFYWYSTPALLKQWQDIVLTFGWAFGPGGTQLEGKKFMAAISTGGQREAYDPSGYNRFPIPTLLTPLDQTAHLCKMIYLPPFVIHGSLVLDPQTTDNFCRSYVATLEGLRDGTLNQETSRDRIYMNHETYGKN